MRVLLFAVSQVMLPEALSGLHILGLHILINIMLDFLFHREAGPRSAIGRAPDS